MSSRYGLHRGSTGITRLCAWPEEPEQAPLSPDYMTGPRSEEGGGGFRGGGTFGSGRLLLLTPLLDHVPLLGDRPFEGPMSCSLLPPSPPALRTQAWLYYPTVGPMPFPSEEGGRETSCPYHQTTSPLISLHHPLLRNAMLRRCLTAPAIPYHHHFL
ncbi:hypothetical protein Tco_1385846 [Tanacetum coccineum]